MKTEKDKFLEQWEVEFPTTLKVLKAFPEAKHDLKPAEKSKSALELAWVFAAEEDVMVGGILVGNIDWTAFKKAPATLHEAISEYEKIHKAMVEKLKHTSEAETIAKVYFPRT